MKSLSSLLLSVVLLGSTSAALASVQKTSELPERREVVVGISDAFVPGGFDSEADAYVIVSGIFQNGCYAWNRGDVKNVTEFNHEIRSVASVSQGMCIMVLVPFQKEIKLGKLSSGTHSLKFMNGDGTYLEKSLVVE